MTKENRATVQKKGVSRRGMIGIGGGAALAAAIAGLAPKRAAAKGSSITLDVVVDGSTNEKRRPMDEDAPATGPFHVKGAIYPAGVMDEEGMVAEDAKPIGEFHCWGWTYDVPDGPPNWEDNRPSNAVNQMWKFDGLGQLMMQGDDAYDKAIVGGTGLFHGARGSTEHNGIVFMGGPRFRATLNFA